MRRGGEEMEDGIRWVYGGEERLIRDKFFFTW